METAGEFAFGLGHVEGRAIEFGDHGDEEDDEGDQSGDPAI